MGLFEKKIPKKNYIKLGLICGVTLAIVFALRCWYVSYQTYQKNIPIIGNVVSQINYNELDNYLTENQDTIIYVGVADDINCRSIEPRLKQYIIKNELKDKVVYLNITSEDNKGNIINYINEQYAVDVKINSYPALIIFNDGKIIDAVSKKGYVQLTAGNMIQLLEEYEVGKE